MKTVFIAFILGLQAVASGGEPVIREGAVGPVTLGASADSVHRAFRGNSRLIDLALEGHLSPALELTLPGTENPGGVVAELVPRGDALIVWRIHVTNPSIKTDKGVGVGSTVRELRAAHRVDSIASGEGLFLMVEELGASFELDLRGGEGETLWLLRDPQRVPGDVKIASILVRGPGHRR